MRGTGKPPATESGKADDRFALLDQQGKVQGGIAQLKGAFFPAIARAPGGYLTAYLGEPVADYWFQVQTQRLDSTGNPASATPGAGPATERVL